MNDLDKSAVYVFVRQDLSENDQRIQISHAVLEMAIKYRPEFARYRIVELDGGVSDKAFRRTGRKVSEKQIAHVAYADPDHPEWGVSAIATVPLTEEQSLPLANYRLRRNSGGAECVRTAGFNANPGASLGLRSSEKEHSVFNGEVAGSSPAVSSNINCS